MKPLARASVLFVFAWCLLPASADAGRALRGRGKSPVRPARPAAEANAPPNEGPATVRNASGEIPIDALTSGTLGMRPRGNVPRRIGAHEHVRGLRMERGPADSGRRPNFSTLIAEGSNIDSAPQRPKALGSQSPTAPPEPSWCVSEVEETDSEEDGEAKTFDREAENWGLDLGSAVHLLGVHGDGAPGTVHVVHVERLIEEPGRLWLEGADLWADPITLGARVFRRARIPLVPAGDPSIPLFAYRDGDFVQFVLRGAKSDAFDPSIQVSLPNGQSLGASGCGHARAPVPLERDSGATAVFQHARVLETKREPVRSSLFGEFENVQSATVRTREYRVFVSASWGARDEKPRLSASFGWAGRERTLPGSFEGGAE